MERKFDANGLQSLDPMRFWKYVMAKKRQHPAVVVFGRLPDHLKEWAKTYPQVNFIVEGDTIEEEISVFIPNVTYRWHTGMNYEEWLERWNWVDYVLCDKNAPEYWLQAQLCGVSPIFNEKELLEILKEIQVLDSVKRIENWESARKSLDLLKKA